MPPRLTDEERAEIAEFQKNLTPEESREVDARLGKVEARVARWGEKARKRAEDGEYLLRKIEEAKSRVARFPTEEELADRSS